MSTECFANAKYFVFFKAVASADFILFFDYTSNQFQFCDTQFKNEAFLRDLLAEKCLRRMGALSTEMQNISFPGYKLTAYPANQALRRQYCFSIF